MASTCSCSYKLIPELLNYPGSQIICLCCHPPSDVTTELWWPQQHLQEAMPLFPVETRAVRRFQGYHVSLPHRNKKWLLGKDWGSSRGGASPTAQLCPTPPLWAFNTPKKSKGRWSSNAGFKASSPSVPLMEIFQALKHCSSASPSKPTQAPNLSLPPALPVCTGPAVLGLQTAEQEASRHSPAPFPLCAPH